MESRGYPLKFMTFLFYVIFLRFSMINADVGHEQNSKSLTCKHYNVNECPKDRPCPETDVICNIQRQQHCFAVYANKSGEFLPQVLGCWESKEWDAPCEDGHCILTHKYYHKDIDRDLYMCCCSGDICNHNLTYKIDAMTRRTPAPVTAPIVIPTTEKEKLPRLVLYYILVPVFGLVIVLGVLFYLWRKHKSAVLSRRPLLDRTPPPTPPIEDRPIQLLEIVSRGQFGRVWRACYDNQMVAVKSIAQHEKQSWTTESTIYMQYNMAHGNILRFVCAEKRQQGLSLEYWILTEFQENGSLADFLRANVIDWSQCLKMVLDTVRGLMFLHSEMPGSVPSKPPIAHRDFKSRNVLVKSDLTCCIGDFGLACAFFADYRAEDAKAQVGTKRYMAPEVLQGAIMFQAESFLSIDMYALALVLWEIVSRCDGSKAPVGDYKAPFEDEVGYHPSLEDMQLVVVENKVRPKLLSEWFEHKGMQVVCHSIEDCWDQDGDARLTAHCVYERLANIDTNVYPNQQASGPMKEPQIVDLSCSSPSSGLSETKIELTASTWQSASVTMASNSGNLEACC